MYRKCLFFLNQNIKKAINYRTFLTNKYTYFDVTCTLKLNVIAINATMMSAIANDTTK